MGKYLTKWPMIVAIAVCKSEGRNVGTTTERATGSLRSDITENVFMDKQAQGRGRRSGRRSRPPI